MEVEYFERRMREEEAAAKAASPEMAAVHAELARKYAAVVETYRTIATLADQSLT